MQEDYVFSTRYRIVEPGTLPSRNDKYICTIYAYVKPEDTRINEELVIMLRVNKFDSNKECQQWVEEVSKSLGQWYLGAEVREFLKTNLSDENFKYLLDEEAELKKEIRQ